MTIFLLIFSSPLFALHRFIKNMKKFLLFLPEMRMIWKLPPREKKSACDVSALVQNFVGIISYLIYIRPAAKSRSLANLLFFFSFILFSRMFLLHFVVLNCFALHQESFYFNNLESDLSGRWLKTHLFGRKMWNSRNCPYQLLTKYKPTSKFKAIGTVICIKSQWKCQIQCMCSVWIER